MGLLSSFGRVLGTVAPIASVIPGVGTAVGAATAVVGALGGGSGPAPPYGSPGEGAYYGFSEAVWERLGSGNRGHVRSGSPPDKARYLIEKYADLLQSGRGMQEAYTAGASAASGGDISRASLLGMPAWFWPAAVAAVGVFFVAKRW